MNGFLNKSKGNIKTPRIKRKWKNIKALRHNTISSRRGFYNSNNSTYIKKSE